MIARSAVEDAVNVYKQPARLHGLAYDQLPPDILNVIKIAACDSETTKFYAESSKIDELKLREAAEFYLHQIFLKAGKSRHLMLALPLAANLEAVRAHRRWLQKWLHPDRAGSKWRSAYFNQVAIAAASLEADITKSVHGDGLVNVASHKSAIVIRPRLAPSKLASKSGSSSPMKRITLPLWVRLKRISLGAKIVIIGALVLVVSLPFIPDITAGLLGAWQNALNRAGF